jgi:hypothetical protein
MYGTTHDHTDGDAHPIAKCRIDRRGRIAYPRVSTENQERGTNSD